MTGNQTMDRTESKKRDKPALRAHRRALKWGCIVAGTVVLYRQGAAWALAERGYHACGGELLLLLLPFLYYIVERICKDFARDIREFWAECEEEEE